MKAHTLTHPALSRRRLLAGAAASTTLGLLGSYAGLGPASTFGLADGQFTRVELQTSPEGSDAWPASRIQAAAIVGAASGREGVKAEIEGYITRFDSATCGRVREPRRPTVLSPNQALLVSDSGGNADVGTAFAPVVLR